MKYLVTSDDHLGHQNTPTSHIIKSFKKHILNDKNKDLDVLFIAGDLLDRLIDLKSIASHEIIAFFHYLLDYCCENNILLRVLEGTPSHDWEQSQHLVTLNQARTRRADLVYHKQLEIEYIERIQKYVLYIPDEWENSHDVLEKQIQAKLYQLNIKQVDIAMLHGQFAYQFAGRPYKGFHFKETYFLSLVRGYIHIGHYHVYSQFDRIIANGSLERLAHGEEGPKGFVIVNNDIATFIENPDAFIYKTLNITANYTVEKLDKRIYSYPKGSHIRLRVKSDHPFNTTYKELKLRYLDYHLKKDIKDDTSESDTGTYITTDNQLEFDDVFVLQANIHQTLSNIIQTKYSLNSVEERKIQDYMSIFKEVNHEDLATG